MPIKTVKFKSDKDMEEELKHPIKSRGYRPFQVDGLADCYQCSNRIKPKCRIGFTEIPCDIKCPVVVEEKRIHEYCPHYEIEKCKEGYPISIVEMPCPKYDGPKVIVEIRTIDSKGKWHIIAKTK